MSARTPLQTLLLAVVEAQATAETLGHPAARPLSTFAETLRDEEDQPETVTIARVFGGWFALVDRAGRGGYLPSDAHLAAPTLPEPRDGTAS